MVKACSLTRLHDLAGRDESLHNFAADAGASTGTCAEEGGFRQIGRILDPENFHSLVGRIQIGLSLVAVRLGLLKVALGDGVVLIEILRTRIVLVRDDARNRPPSNMRPATANNRDCSTSSIGWPALTRCPEVRRGYGSQVHQPE